MGKNWRYFLVLCVFTIAVAALIIFYPVKVNYENLPVNSQVATSPTAEECLANLPMDFLTGQLLMVGISSADLTTQTPIFRSKNIGGAVLMTAPADPNDGSIKSFKKQASNYNVPPLISTDEEGGEVQRFAVLGSLPSQAEIAATLSTNAARQLIIDHGKKLKAIGVDMVLGPVADVAPLSGESVLGDRLFSNDPNVTRSFVLAYERGWHNAGLLATLKHFPGLGLASANTDYEPATTPPLSELETRDFRPYQQTYHRSVAVMVGHQNVPGWSAGPASLSPVVIQYLRNELQYQNNLVITDALNAPAIANQYGIEQAVLAAITAGNDIALFIIDSTDATTSESIITSVENTLQSAINNGSLPRDQLFASVNRKLQAQRNNPCLVKSNASP
jgi:beta-N-acetylhexosaminidase